MSVSIYVPVDLCSVMQEAAENGGDLAEALDGLAQEIDAGIDDDVRNEVVDALSGKTINALHDFFADLKRRAEVGQ